MSERETRKPLKCLKINNGWQYCSNKFVHYSSQYNIRQKKNIPHTPKHIRVAERMNKTLNERVRSMLSSTKLSKSFWDEALNTACNMVIRLPSQAFEGDVQQHV